MIIHIDMDAFFAAIEVRDRPELADQPVVVGGSPDGRGVVSTANYVARTYGVHSAMPAAQAKRLCPKAIFLKPRMDHYAEVAKHLRALFHTYTALVEPLSLDEAFLDVTPSHHLFGGPVAIAQRIQRQIVEELGLTASAGVAPNKFLAKLASDLEKPHGLVVVDPDHIQSFLDPLEISRLWGIGKQTLPKFHAIGIRTIHDLRQRPLATLQTVFGNSADHYWQLAHGIDDRKVIPERETKSISNETTFATNIEDLETLIAWMHELSDLVARRMRNAGLMGRTIAIKIRYANFETITRSVTLSQPTNGTRTLNEVACQLLRDNAKQLQRGIRLLGMGVSQLSLNAPRQLSLFQEEDDGKERRLDAATDSIQHKFGRGALKRGSSLEHRAAKDHSRPAGHDPSLSASSNENR